MKEKAERAKIKIKFESTEFQLLLVEMAKLDKGMLIWHRKKQCNSLVLVNLEDLFVFSPCQVTRGHKFKLCKRQNTHNVRANFFSERVTTCWNSLPDTVDFSSFTSFKRTVKQVNLTQFLRIQVCN